MADNFSVLTSNGTTTATFRATDNGGGILVMMSIPTNKSGTAMIGSSVVANSIPFTLATDSPALPVAAATVPSLLGVISTGGAPAAVAIKNASGTIKLISGYNNNSASPVFLKLYNASAGGVTVGTQAPLFIVGFAPGAPNSVPFGDGGAFTTAMSYAITGLVPNTDTSSVNVDDLHAVISFI